MTAQSEKHEHSDPMAIPGATAPADASKARVARSGRIGAATQAQSLPGAKKVKRKGWAKKVAEGLVPVPAQAPTPTEPQAPQAPQAPPGGALAPPRTRPRLRSLDAPTWPQVLADLRLAVPFDVAVRCAGLDPDSASKALRIDVGAAQEVETARAEGERRLLLDTTLDPRDRQWRLERLYPRRYHLPMRVTGVAAEDGGAPVESRVELSLVDARALARGVVSSPASIPLSAVALASVRADTPE